MHLIKVTVARQGAGTAQLQGGTGIGKQQSSLAMHNITLQAAWRFCLFIPD